MFVMEDNVGFFISCPLEDKASRYYIDVHHVMVVEVHENALNQRLLELGNTRSSSSNIYSTMLPKLVITIS